MTGIGMGGRVETPKGTGKVIGVHPDEEWEFGKLVKVIWVRVELDDGSLWTFNIDECEPAADE